MTRNECLEILELPTTASQEDVVIAYRQLAQVWHPDRFPNNAPLQQKANAKLARINEAYQSLRNQKFTSKTSPSSEASHGLQKSRRSGYFAGSITAIFLVAACFLFRPAVKPDPSEALAGLQHDPILSSGSNDALHEESDFTTVNEVPSQNWETENPKFALESFTKAEQTSPQIEAQRNPSFPIAIEAIDVMAAAPSHDTALDSQPLAVGELNEKPQNPVETAADAPANSIAVAAAEVPIPPLEIAQASEATPPKSLPPVLKITPATLKKKFAGKATFNQKTNELTLKYDFGSKKQLSDFMIVKQKYQVNEKVLYLDAAEELIHKAKFQEFTVSTTIQVKAMRHAGLATTKEVKFDTGGLNLDAIYLHIPEGPTPVIPKIVPVSLRSGTIAMSLSVSSTKTTGRWNDEVLAAPTVRKSDIHQIKLLAGDDGCYFTDLVIVGTPDPTWFEEFLKSE